MFERFSKPARSAIVVAQEQARDFRSPAIGIEHLLLGITMCSGTDLRNVLAGNGVTADNVQAALGDRRAEEPLGEEDAAALRSIGIDLESVRESLEATFGADALERAVPADAPSRRRFPLGGPLHFGHIPFSGGAKKALELSLREAVSRGDDRIEAGHVLLGIMRAANPPTRTLLGGDEGIQRLRAAVQQLLDHAA
ncbi:Clp protease [Mycobacterium sp. MYCO198283]|uniref:Clp protease N-terminal domain-containing protein n=1 Tax=Mycobacterium sp. MYCO198283 TaxID=2883505 RepID=UPI001E3C4ED7|nr:Clp protease N-terminal domain-containing protein [Mycobacterium sp. MYCO198283]MCG5431066.1 Clp protease [Mycobacterium sp. MYCO198283]